MKTKKKIDEMKKDVISENNVGKVINFMEKNIFFPNELDLPTVFMILNPLVESISKYFFQAKIAPYSMTAKIIGK